MIKTDLRKNFEIDNCFIKNFINLNDEEHETVVNLRNDNEIRKWMCQDHIISKEEHNEFAEKLKSDDRNYFWLVVDKNSNKHIGVIYLKDFSEDGTIAYLGLYANLNLQIKGLGKRLIDILKIIAFDEAKLELLKLRVFETNERAKKLYEKTGFVFKGYSNDCYFRDGNEIKLLEMELKSGNE